VEDPQGGGGGVYSVSVRENPKKRAGVASG
jgi:hypothetical protein